MVNLRKLVASDSLRIARLLNNKLIWDQLCDYIPYPYTPADGSDFIIKMRRDAEEKVFGIESDEQLVGIIGITLQKDIHRLSADVGYWLGEEYWGCGIMTSALGKMLGIAFNDLHLLRVFASVKELNTASQRVLEKSGFVLEGVFKNAIIKNDIIQDEYRYARLNPNFPV